MQSTTLTGHHRRRTRIVSLLAAALMALTACGGGGGDQSAGAADTLKIALGLAVSTMNPQAANLLDGNVLTNVYDGLFAVAPNGDIVPALAADMTESADGTVYTVHLRDGVKFHDGQTLTADDVKFSLDRVRDPDTASPYASDLSNIDSVATAGDNIVELKTKGPDPLLRSRLAGLSAMILPKEYFEKVGPDEFGKHRVGTGPYKFESMVPSQEVVLTAFDGYWGPQKPEIARVEYKMVPQAATRAAMLQSGEVDIANNLDTTAATTLESDKIKVVGVSSGSVLFLQASQQDPRFKDIRVVQALNYAINRQGIVDSVLHGFAQPIGGLIPPDLPGFAPAVIPPYPYDPDKARQLLAESGADFSQPLDFDVPTGRWANASESAQAIVSDLAAVGVKLNLHMMDFSAYLKKNEEHTISALFPDNLSARVRDMIPGVAGSFGCGELYSFSCDPAFDELVAQADGLAGDARVQATKALMQRMHDNPRVVFLWSLESVFGISSHVEWTPTPATEIINLRDARLTS